MPLKHFNKVWFIIIFLLVGISGLYVFFVQPETSHTTPQTSVSPLFDTSSWFNTQMPGKLLIRDTTDGKNLLLTMRDEFEKRNRHRAVYQYNPGVQSLQAVSNDEWDTAAGPITECFSQSQQVPEKFKIKGERLFFGNQEIPIKGTALISLSYSPRGNVVAVLSADGPRKKGFLPFLGGGQNSKGQHYHQLFSVRNAAPIGDVVKLQFTTEKEAYPACWSTDEKYVFYTALLADKLTIVKTGLSNGQIVALDNST